MQICVLPQLRGEDGGAGMSELKPCPFCGGALHIWKHQHQIMPKIGKVAECDKCGVRISIPWALEEFQVVEFLNRRSET